MKLYRQPEPDNEKLELSPASDYDGVSRENNGCIPAEDGEDKLEELSCFSDNQDSE